MKNIDSGLLRFVCHQMRRDEFQSVIQAGPGGSAGATLRWVFDGAQEGRLPPWAAGLCFGEMCLTQPVQVVRLSELVRRLRDHGETIGVMGVERLQRVKALFFDMDATVIVEESLVELAATRGVSEQVHRITEQAMAGKIDFAAALRERVAMLEGTPVAEVKALLERLTLQPGITELVDRCRKQRIPCYMVSGGFTILAEPLGEIVGMSGVRANRFGIRTQWEERQTAPLEVLSGQVEGPLVDAQGKRQYLLETCAQEGFAPSEVIAVGDGANDLLMIETALYGVGLKPKEALRPVLHLQNQLGDHRLLGYFLYGDLS